MFKRCLSTAGFTHLRSRSVLRVAGPDATKFLNGLITSKMIPQGTKRLAMTVEEEREQSLQLPTFDMSKDWGVLQESPETSNHTVSRLGLYTMFLNSKGRIMTDAWIYPRFLPQGDLSAQDAEYLVETDSSMIKHLSTMFALHKLRSKVTVSPVEDVNIWGVYNDEEMDSLFEIQQDYIDPESQVKTPLEAYANMQKLLLSPLFQEGIDGGSITAMAFDNRVPDSGLRLILPTSIDPIQIISQSYLTHRQSIPEEHYHIRRSLFGVPETPSDITPNKFLPLEFNLEFMGGVHFDKGCYTGQELTVRTFHTGVVRKRVVPVRLYDLSIPMAPDGLTLEYVQDDPVCGMVPRGQWEIVADQKEQEQRLAASPFGNVSSKSVRSRKTSRSSGTLLSTYGNIGLALVRLEDFAKDDTQFHVNIPGAGDGNKDLRVGVKAFIPYWWPE